MKAYEVYTLEGLGWCKGAAARDRNGREIVGLLHDNTAAVCSLGAIWRVYLDKAEREYAIYRLAESVGGGSHDISELIISDWNDSHSKKTVVAKLQALDI